MCVTTNLATQKAIEGQHNHRLDSIASKKKKLELSVQETKNESYGAYVTGFPNENMDGILFGTPDPDLHTLRASSWRSSHPHAVPEIPAP